MEVSDEQEWTELLRELNSTIRDLLTLGCRSASVVPPPSRPRASNIPILQDLPSPLRLCFWIEKILSHNLKSGIFKRSTMWSFLENLPKFVPETEELFSLLSRRHRNPCGRARGLIQVAISEGSLAGYVTALLKDEDLTKVHYRSNALLRQSDQAYIFSQLLLSLNPITFQFDGDDDLDNEYFWENYGQKESEKEESKKVKASVSLPSLVELPQNGTSEQQQQQQQQKKKGKRKAKLRAIDIPEEQKQIRETHALEAEIEQFRMTTLELRISLQKEVQKNENRTKELQISQNETSEWKEKCSKIEEELKYYQDYFKDKSRKEMILGIEREDGGVERERRRGGEERERGKGEVGEREKGEPADWLRLVRELNGGEIDFEEEEEEESEGEDGEEDGEKKERRRKREEKRAKVLETFNEAGETISELVDEGSQLISKLHEFEIPELTQFE